MATDNDAEHKGMKKRNYKITYVRSNDLESAQNKLSIVNSKDLDTVRSKQEEI